MINSPDRTKGGSNRQSFIDFKPLDLADISINAKTRQRQSKDASKTGISILDKTQIAEKKGIAQLIAGVSGSKIDIDRQYADILSNYDSRSRASGDEGVARSHRSTTAIRPIAGDYFSA